MLSDLIPANIYNVVRSVIDILSLSLIFFYVFRVLKTMRSSLFLVRFLSVLAVYAIAFLLDLEVLLWVFNNTFLILVIGTIIVFQSEFRNSITKRLLSNPISPLKKTVQTTDFNLISKSVDYLKDRTRGAIIILEKDVSLEEIITNKVQIDALLSVEILVSFFSHDTLLHDGAVIIKENRVKFAGCFLPIDLSTDVPYTLGSRHRAAMGIAKNTDAAVIVLSEQRGSVTLAYKERLFYDMGVEKACRYAQLILEDNFADIEMRDFLEPTKTV